MVGSKPVANAELLGDDAADRARRFHLLTQIANDDPQSLGTWFLPRLPTREEYAFMGHHAPNMEALPDGSVRRGFSRHRSTMTGRRVPSAAIVFPFDAVAAVSRRFKVFRDSILFGKTASA